jgi:hypothetical protein
MPLVQERRQGGHLGHLAVAGTPKTGTTTQRSFGSHRLFQLVSAETKGTSSKTYTGHMDLIHRLEPVEEAG